MPFILASGAWPRPLLMWQLLQERVLNSGPNPSLAVVEEGDGTQNFLKTFSPI